MEKEAMKVSLTSGINQFALNIQMTFKKSDQNALDLLSNLAMELAMASRKKKPPSTSRLREIFTRLEISMKNKGFVIEKATVKPSGDLFRRVLLFKKT